MAKKPNKPARPPKDVNRTLELILGSAIELLPGILGLVSMFAKRGTVIVPPESKDYRFSTSNYDDVKSTDRN